MSTYERKNKKVGHPAELWNISKDWHLACLVIVEEMRRPGEVVLHTSTVQAESYFYLCRCFIFHCPYNFLTLLWALWLDRSGRPLVFGDYLRILKSWFWRKTAPINYLYGSTGFVDQVGRSFPSILEIFHAHMLVRVTIYQLMELIITPRSGLLGQQALTVRVRSVLHA